MGCIQKWSASPLLMFHWLELSHEATLIMLGEAVQPCTQEEEGSMDFDEWMSDSATPVFKSFILSWIYRYPQHDLRVSNVRNSFILRIIIIIKPGKT